MTTKIQQIVETVVPQPRDKALKIIEPCILTPKDRAYNLIMNFSTLNFVKYGEYLNSKNLTILYNGETKQLIIRGILKGVS